MEKMSTAQLIRRFIEERKIDGIRIKTLSDMVENGYIDEAEKKIGKSILQMNFQEITQFLDCVITFEAGSDYPVSYAMYYARYNAFDRILTYYRDTYDTANVLSGRRAATAYNDYIKNHLRITKKIIDDYIYQAHIMFADDKADYVELLIRLTYDGFFGFKEIVKFKKNLFNGKFLIARVDGHRIGLSERTFELLKKFEKLETLDNDKRLALVSWQGGYVRDVCFENSRVKLEEKPLNDFVKHFYNTYTRYVIQELEFPIKHTMVYFLGFYNFCVDKVGEERMGKILLKEADKIATKHLLELMTQYDFKFESDRGTISIPHLKADLKAFLPKEVL